MQLEYNPFNPQFEEDPVEAFNLACRFNDVDSGM